MKTITINWLNTDEKTFEQVSKKVFLKEKMDNTIIIHFGTLTRYYRLIKQTLAHKISKQEMKNV